MSNYQRVEKHWVQSMGIGVIPMCNLGLASYLAEPWLVFPIRQRQLSSPSRAYPR